MYLNTHTYYSFKYGAISPEELLVEGQKCDVKVLPLTDINSTAGCLNFVRLSEKYNIRPVLGIDFRNGVKQQYVGLARNNEGFKELNDHLSAHLHSKADFADQAPDFDHAYVIYPFASYGGKALKTNEFLGVTPADLLKLRFSYSKYDPEKLVILQTVTFRGKRDFNAHRLLRAIDNNTLLSKLPKSEEGEQHHSMMLVGELKERYKEFPRVIENTCMLLDECSISFEFGETAHLNLSTYTGSEECDYQLVKRLCQRGLKYRYDNPGPQIFERIEKELEMIRKKGFLAYFLINCKIINYARKKGYFYVGRGSGANSIVAYLLRITDVDPVELDLYFERFINLYRKNPPDFDIDFSWRDREDITRFIFEYFNKRVPGGVALLATYSTFQYRATVRELGKVFGLPPHEINRLADGGEATDDISRLVLKYGSLIADLPSHLSIHAGGILIAEKSIHYYTATSLPPKGFPVTHFDMLIAEDIGLYKFDILAQRGLGKIKDALQIIKDNRPDADEIDIHDIKRFKEDERVKEILREGQAIGCFYVESPAMRMLLKKLRVDHYLALVAASSIIRPGVAKSGMMREYILRFRDPERVKDAHPVLLEIMPDTFGVMVYQEDVIKVAYHFAGLDLGEADVLRRGMSGKFRSREEFQQVREKYFASCRELGRPVELAVDVWRQIESFAGYAFAKGHSASYAVESYQSLYLKAHYPIEFMVSVLNNGGGFYRSELYIHEARMHGAKVVPPCVNKSEAYSVIEGARIYLGFELIKDLESRVIDNILQVRKKRPFLNLGDFLKRVFISLEQLSLLIRAGGFRFTGKSKKELLWQAHMMLGQTKRSNPVSSLFDAPVKEITLPKLYTYQFEDAFEEMELFGFPLCDPFLLLKEKVIPAIETFRPATVERVADLKNHLNEEVVIYGYLVAIKNTSTSKGDRMYFGTFLDRAGHFIDTVHFPPVAAKYHFRGKGIYKITGKVVVEFGFYTIEVTAMEKLPYIDDPRYTNDVESLEIIKS
ncbi:DNA polymerase III alpha subunit [Fulvivirga imtechensis AK7]|uniref:DNA polymerase III subunit alpha n=1 Tax=Fulvivirga imtechensis AK7 TaxID=1237149 RepID=L8JVR5_9BACT|nr:PHP domain-containing protein [Fulvivirga imtechensis]ELR73141.1 DNA polymerase III alpha subunit [Fulvivirga imtechensis AK7]